MTEWAEALARGATDDYVRCRILGAQFNVAGEDLAIEILGERRCSGLFVLDCEYGLETTVCQSKSKAEPPGPCEEVNGADRLGGHIGNVTNRV